jgi:hypothetical protein
MLGSSGGRYWPLVEFWPLLPVCLVQGTSAVADRRAAHLSSLPLGTRARDGAPGRNALGPTCRVACFLSKNGGPTLSDARRQSRRQRCALFGLVAGVGGGRGGVSPRRQQKLVRCESGRAIRADHLMRLNTEEKPDASRQATSNPPISPLPPSGGELIGSCSASECRTRAGRTRCCSAPPA